MSGARRAFVAYTEFFPGRDVSFSSYTFTAPDQGVYKFVLWGSGTFGNTAGGSGAYCEYSRQMAKGQTVALVVPTSSGGLPTTATFPDGKVVSAGFGGVGVAGIASGGDVNLNGSLAGVAGLGSGGGTSGVGAGGGAPGVLPFRGGSGSTAGGGFTLTCTPGASAPSSGANQAGGAGLIIVMRVS